MTPRPVSLISELRNDNLQFPWAAKNIWQFWEISSGANEKLPRNIKTPSPQEQIEHKYSSANNKVNG